MNSTVLKKLMGDKSLDDFISERQKAIQEIGRRSSTYAFKNVQKNGHSQTELYPDWSNKVREGSSKAQG